LLTSINMVAKLKRVIELPEGITASVNDEEIKISGNGKELVRTFNLSGILIKVAGNTLELSSKRTTRRESKLIGTAWAHINNMIRGVGEDFVYKLEVTNVHFPMNVKAEGEKILIKSFLGETTERVARIMPGSNVDIKGNEITVSSSNIESAGQTAANLEKATRLTGRDRRIFQDGIYITEKPGRII
jgi:large subunit ribosomal protein L6